MERIKWMFIEKWGIYTLIMIALIGLFMPFYAEYIFFGGIFALLGISEIYLISKNKSPKIICRYCGKSLILLPISPPVLFQYSPPIFSFCRLPGAIISVGLTVTGFA